MSDYSYIFNAHPTYIDAMYKTYKENPETLDDGWRTFFQGFEFAASQNGNGQATAKSGTMDNREFNALAIIFAFRNRGHLLSTTNPIRERKDRRPNLDLEDYHLSELDLGEVFHVGEEIGLKNATLQQIIDHLKKIYCGNIGFEYAYIEDREKRIWLREQIESNLANGFQFDGKKKQRILEKLNGAVVFEKFLHSKYVGQKRFSLEGGETTIAALDAIINEAADGGVEEVIIGMAHRGRLNVLANIMGKTYKEIFNEFEGYVLPDHSFGDGDVKYHLGFSAQMKTPNKKKITLKLTPNPSHLEAVNPVVEGFARAKADILYGSDYDKILPILIHGDAAIAGQGVVYEVAQMSKLDGYYTGGTIHFVINNQIGFTTDFDDARSATYCTSIATLVQAPVFHVNGDDPEAVVFAVELATKYRQKFNSDVYIDMVCYRRHGHNEGDEPKFTQPAMYKVISKHPNPRDIYTKLLVDRGDFDAKLAEKMDKEFWNFLQQRLDDVKQKPLPYKLQEPELEWLKLKPFTTPEDFHTSPATGISKKKVDTIIKHLMTIPKDFTALSKINRILKGKQKLLAKNQLDWGLAELIAYGSILLEGKDVRMSGQDVKRGTFSHRHAVLMDVETNEEYNRLNTITKKQGEFRIFNSLLSEFGVLGFEFGYSLASPHTLVIWEAQFGDFYNGAQVMVDQFISASESKWNWTSGLVMLLPHGYAGQGPEHSSARFERFLQLCAEENMSVVNITTPANFFHALRRQLERQFRKPLIVMSPKSLLRHPKCVSDISEITSGSFEEVLDDATVGNKKTDIKKIKRVLCCTGKIYYQLLEEREKQKRNDVAIIRLEQLYPLPEIKINALIKKYENAEAYWVQEEPSNMGAWQYILTRYRRNTMKLIARKSSASTATGFKKRHEEEQKELIAKAFEG